MSTIVRPAVVNDSCLRGRRRSTIHLINSVPKIFASVSPTPDDNTSEKLLAVDEPAVKSSAIDIAPTLTSLTLPFPSNAHLPDFATRFTVPRHSDTSLSPVDISSPLVSPVTSPTTSPPISRKASLAELLPEKNVHVHEKSPKQERLKWRLAAGFFAFFLSGWGDGVTATVIPYLMTDFHLSPMTLSLLYLGTTIGFALSTFTVERFLNFLGQFNYTKSQSPWLLPASPRLSALIGEKVSPDDIGHSVSQARLLALVLGGILNASFFALMASHTGFAAMFVAYAIAAVARSLWTTPLNAYFAQGPKHAMGISYGLWSLGSVAAPFVAQSLLSHGTPWPHFYSGSMVICALNLTFLCLTFRPTANELAEERRAAAQAKGKSSTEDFLAAAFQSAEDPSAIAITTECRPEQTLRLALSIPRHWTLIFTAMMYTGSETCTIAFMVTFLLEARHANNSAGYVTSGFWGGITIGRLLWGYVSSRVSYRVRKYIVQVNLKAVCVSVALRLDAILKNFNAVIALAMHLLIWLTSDVFGDSFSASLIGLFYGPVFPAMLSMATDILPDEVHLISMALVTTSATVGGALFPFILGTIMKIKGANALSYMNIPLAITLAMLWALLPSQVPRNRFSVNN
ncbi:hypothetical protein M378DRAFT_6885 [Amanita muscaria Koide BX008]|uniref:Major facilitator superfamily (MFS) profile domain-containing protein n=1 Tax=Amanita muscaria (strain Koide BX008) TaxID=946122 RepID=A0A0C2XN93_AMAMK|nr:hypothetical protein M378DRAFT_6885 [Amanita muscaria Koide BX008]